MTSLPNELIQILNQQLSTELSVPCQVSGDSPVSGGCIHQARRLDTTQGTFFLKYNRRAAVPMFVAEHNGLTKLANAQSISLTAPVGVGCSTQHSYLLHHWIEPAPRTPHFWENFGHSLAALHRHTASTYGLDEDNFIGSLPQSNARQAKGIHFFIHQRLAPQLQFAQANGLADRSLQRQFDALYRRLPQLLPDVPSSLLHGDLWSGNFMTDAHGEAILIDPAVYYGHREAELAFTRLFGGFQPTFYQAYQEAWPLEPGWQSRVDLFNLYPLMVHLNLFGRSYLLNIQETLRKYA